MSNANITRSLHIKREIPQRAAAANDKNRGKARSTPIRFLLGHHRYGSNPPKPQTMNLGEGNSKRIDLPPLRWSARDILRSLKHHPLPCMCGLSLCFFMVVEYTLRMIPCTSPPLDIGFLLTRSLNSFLATRPSVNSALAALNTAFVGMQAAYILWTLLMDGRATATIAALFMFTCRGIMGCSTQLPLPQDFLGSGVDFPVGNVSFFLFFSGHVAGSVIASLDMRRMRRYEMAWMFDALNVLQSLRLLATRGHYTIDLAVGAGAGFLFDTLACRYQLSRRIPTGKPSRPCAKDASAASLFNDSS